MPLLRSRTVQRLIFHLSIRPPLFNFVVCRELSRNLAIESDAFPFWTEILCCNRTVMEQELAVSYRNLLIFWRSHTYVTHFRPLVIGSIVNCKSPESSKIQNIDRGIFRRSLFYWREPTSFFRRVISISASHQIVQHITSPSGRRPRISLLCDYRS